MQRAPRPAGHGSRRDRGRDRVGVVERYRTRAAAGDPGRARGRPRGSRNGCPSRSPRPRTRTSSRRPSTRSACATSSARSCRRTRCRTASPRRTCTCVAASQPGRRSRSVPGRRGLRQRRAGRQGRRDVRRADPERERPAAGRHARSSPTSSSTRWPTSTRTDWAADRPGRAGGRCRARARVRFSGPRVPDCRRGSAAHGRSRLPAVPVRFARLVLGRPRAQRGPRAVRRPRAPPAGPGDLRDQPPQLGRPAGAPRGAARAGRSSRCSAPRRRTCARAVATG